MKWIKYLLQSLFGVVMLLGWGSCSKEEVVAPSTPQPPSGESEYVYLGLQFKEAEGKNTFEYGEYYALYFRAYAHANQIEGFDLYAPFYGWIESRVLPEPIIQLNRVNSTTSTLTFGLSVGYASEVRWLCVEDGVEPSVEEVLSQGYPVKVGAEMQVLVEGLERETAYVIYAVAQNDFCRVSAEPLKMTTLAEDSEETPDETPDEDPDQGEDLTRRFDDDQPTPDPIEPSDLLRSDLQFLPEYFLDESGYAYFSVGENIMVWNGDGAIDSYYDYRMGLFGLLIPTALYEYPEAYYYDFRVCLFQPSSGTYFRTGWHRLDMGELRSTITLQ